MLQAGGLACDTVCIGACLQPGSYFVTITPTQYTPCAQSHYALSLQCQPFSDCAECDPAATIPEGEPCPNFPDTFNGGCVNNQVYTSPIQCGDDICGSLHSDFSNLDRDVYSVTLTGYTEIMWCVEFDRFYASINNIQPVGGGCGNNIIWAQNATYYGCEMICVSACLPPGTYWLDVQLGQYGVNCGTYVAHLDCTPCPPPCVMCPPGGIPENEPCPNLPDYYNGGCYWGGSPTAMPIQCGDTICGTSTSYDYPDHDFYQLTLAQSDSVIWCVKAEYPVLASIYLPTANCTNLVPLVQDSAGECATACVSVCLPPGVYWLHTQPLINLFNHCKTYVASVTCLPCSAAVTCNYPDLDFDPQNDACSTTNVNLQCQDTLCGEIISPQDVDWYQFTIPFGMPCVSLEIDVFGDDTPGFYPFGLGLNSGVRLRASDCTTILAQDNDGGIGTDALLTSACLTPGTYFIEVGGVAGTMGPYVLALECRICPCPPPCPYPDLDIEVGMDTCNVSPVAVACGDTLCGRIDPAGDADWYTLFVQGPGCFNVNIDVFADSTPGWWPYQQGLDPQLWLLQSDCSTQVAYDNDGGVGTDSYLSSPCLPAGQYQIKISGFMGAGIPETGPYILAIACTPCPCDTCPYADLDFDPSNDACGSPQLVTLHCADTLCGEIISPQDLDWYQFNIPFGTPCVSLEIDIFADSAIGYYPYGQGLNSGVALYQSNCTSQIGFDDDGGVGTDSRLVSVCLTPGIYYIAVGGVGATTGPYILALNCRVCPCPPPCPYADADFDPQNDVCPPPVPPMLSCDDTICGEIMPYGDEDWYAVNVPNFGSCVILDIDVFADSTPGWYPYQQGLNSEIWLYESDCVTQVAYDNDGGVGTDSHLGSPCIQPGLYYIKIGGAGQQGQLTQGPYIVTFLCSSCICDTCPYTNLDMEPANDQCQPSPVNVQCGDTLCGEIDNSQGLVDVDWYQFFVPSPGCTRVIIDVYGNDTPGWYPFGLGLDPRISIWASDCATILNFDDNSGVGNDAVLASPCLQPGFYYIRIEGVNNTAGPYIFTLLCEGCECPCNISCPPNWPGDGEACPNFGPDTYNGGCQVTPPAFGSIACGQRFCGTSFAMGGIRDEDWFQLNLTVPRRILWTVRADFPYEMAIFRPNPNCANLDTLRYTTGNPCQTKFAFIWCLAPGTYYFYIAPSVSTGVPCSDYVTRLQCGKCFIIDVVVHVESPHLRLAWSPDETAPVYNIYRSADSNLEPLDENLIGSTQDTTFVDANVLAQPAEKYFYIVTMQNPDSVGEGGIGE